MYVKFVESGSVASFGGSVIGPRRNYYMQVGDNFSPSDALVDLPNRYCAHHPEDRIMIKKIK